MSVDTAAPLLDQWQHEPVEGKLTLLRDATVSNAEAVEELRNDGKRYAEDQRKRSALIEQDLSEYKTATGAQNEAIASALRTMASELITLRTSVGDLAESQGRIAAELSTRAKQEIVQDSVLVKHGKLLNLRNMLIFVAMIVAHALHDLLKHFVGGL